ncbi:hypothetical protein, partial [Hyphomicrobium sulfonivorans]|uniref:hypothetical protein n=1 Tax=Hyphomicrobium sulfonivorans TaxID=121290 RepID=UPI001AEBE0A6
FRTGRLILSVFAAAGRGNTATSLLTFLSNELVCHAIPRLCLRQAQIAQVIFCYLSHQQRLNCRIWIIVQAFKFRQERESDRNGN